MTELLPYLPPYLPPYLLPCLLLLPLILPAFALLALTCAALLPTRRQSFDEAAGLAPPRVAVLVPAHDESRHLLPTVEGLLAELGAADRLLVVADNCSDDTAELARLAGAEVIERFDPQRRGKGYALAFGVDHLRADPPDVVLVVDADCALSAGALAAIARECRRTGRPVQMLDLIDAPHGSGLRQRALAFAMVMKNLVRPLGSDRLGGVCQLMGTGMALPWALAASARLATGHLAEDMQLGIEMTRAGHAPRFFVGARVSAEFASDDATLRQQKTRWEHGHLDTLREQVPGLLRSAIAQRSRPLAVLALDLMIPPVALYLLVLLTLTTLAGVGAGFWPPLAAAAALCVAASAAFVLAILLGWWHFGRHLIQAHELLRLPLYALWKLPIYVAYAVGARSAWVRTNRTSPVTDVPGPGTMQP